MYIWVGCRLPENFQREIRDHCLVLNQRVGLNTEAFALPQHISLKISFNSSRVEEIMEFLTQTLSQQHPFQVSLMNVEQEGEILWIPVAENSRLQELHGVLDRELERRFDISQHPFDKNFLFHSTLFIDQDREKVSRMRRMLADYPMARELWVDTFLLGQSETGTAGSYHVVCEIKV